MFIGIIIFITVAILEYTIGLYAYIVRKSLAKTYAFPLSSQLDSAEMLQRYSRIHRKVNIKVHGNISPPSQAVDEVLVMNRNKVYQFDLFSTLTTLYQAEMTRDSSVKLKDLHIIQNILFFVQYAAFAASLIIVNDTKEYILYLAIGIQFILFALSLFLFSRYEKILQETLKIGEDLLELEELEYVRAEALIKDLRYEVFEYPIDMATKLVKFFIPIRI